MAKRSCPDLEINAHKNIAGTKTKLLLETRENVDCPLHIPSSIAFSHDETDEATGATLPKTGVISRASAAGQPRLASHQCCVSAAVLCPVTEKVQPHE
jgi:hypothetical protein